MFLKPKAGQRVLDPNQNPPQPLPEGGRKVADSAYWQRRLTEGVVEIVSETKPAKKSKENNGAA
ncbi:DUF2635 domain-containing protein [Deltaproteobacteria bacterium Smac51]|nr:DUF2635 domain-containing protein [Deltaproteobacteria bacterium Smac51]UQZ91275.1 DUF2635 domain-containing protein [Deltaproteobacteria bacterium Smac51]